MKYRTTYKYNIINKRGHQEPWTGIFKTKIDAYNWKALHGKDLNLVLIKNIYVV